jgi:hypothetical protein
MRPRWFQPLGTTMGEGIAYVSAPHCHQPLTLTLQITLQTTWRTLHAVSTVSPMSTCRVSFPLLQNCCFLLF